MESPARKQDEDRQRGTRTASLPLRKKLLFAGVTCLVVLAVFEIAARLLAPAETVGVYDEHQRIIKVGGLPALNEALEFDAARFWRLKANVRDLRVAGVLGEHPLDFRISTHGRYRSPSVAESKAAYRILAIGDSCTFGVGVDDDECWPAVLQNQFLRAGKSVEVINAGVPGYTAFQGQAYLESEGLGLRPDLVVACFGFNDRDTWASRSDDETARLLASNDTPLMHSRLYAVIRNALRGREDPARVDGGRPRLSITEFRRTLRDIHQLCEQRGAELVLLVWPFEPQVRFGVRDLEPYQTTVIQMGARGDVQVVNLVDAFIDSQQQDLFVDHIHASPAGCRLVADALFQELHSRVR